MMPDTASATTMAGEAATRLLIGGRWVEARSGKSFDTVDPSTGSVIGKAAAGDSVDVDEAVAAARKAFEEPAWQGMSPHDRTRLLLRIADVIDRNADELAAIESRNNGAPLTIAKALVAGVVETFVYYAGSGSAATSCRGMDRWGARHGSWRLRLRAATLQS